MMTRIAHLFEKSFWPWGQFEFFFQMRTKLIRNIDETRSWALKCAV